MGLRRQIDCWTGMGGIGCRSLDQAGDLGRRRHAGAAGQVFEWRGRSRRRDGGWAAGLGLAIVSARPPRGMAWIVEALLLPGPYAGFNGGLLVGPDGTVVEWNPAPAELVERALALFAARGVDAWLFHCRMSG